MPKTIVSHISPDLDGITSIWLLLRFGGMDDANMEFVSVGSTLDDMSVDSDPDIIHVDTGFGRFDHHQESKSKAFKCAAKLVAEAYAPTNPVVGKIADYVNLVDYGQAPLEGAAYPFGIINLLQGFKLIHPDTPEHVVRLMLPCLDAWYRAVEEEQMLVEEFRKRREFCTQWGLGVAMESEFHGAARMAYQQGAVIFAFHGSHGMGVVADGKSNVDLTPLYECLRSNDPVADWYLHPTKRMLLCGSTKKKNTRLSELNLSDLIDLIISIHGKTKPTDTRNS